MKKIPLNTVGLLKDYELNSYLDDQLAPKTRFCRRLSRDEIMKWQAYEISEPLITILNPILHETATSMFNRKKYFFFHLISIKKAFHKIIIYKTSVNFQKKLNLNC